MEASCGPINTGRIASIKRSVFCFCSELSPCRPQAATRTAQQKHPASRTQSNPSGCLIPLMPPVPEPPHQPCARSPATRSPSARSFRCRRTPATPSSATADKASVAGSGTFWRVVVAVPLTEYSFTKSYPA